MHEHNTTLIVLIERHSNCVPAGMKIALHGLFSLIRIIVAINIEGYSFIDTHNVTSISQEHVTRQICRPIVSYWSFRLLI